MEAVKQAETICSDKRLSKLIIIN